MPVLTSASRLRFTVVVLLCVGTVAAFSLTAAADAAQDAGRTKKLIAVGWDLHSDTAWIREHHRAMQERPFNGIVITAVGKRDDGKPVPLYLTFQPEPWREEWFRGAIEDLKACRWTTFTDNFLMVHSNPGSVDWFDDAAWPAVVEHWRIAARVAREGGLKGITFDPEPYYPPHTPFNYFVAPQKDRGTFEQVSAKVRQRGREIMRAVAAEFPNATILSFFFNSVCSRAAGQPDARKMLASEHYGLMPAFLDGWLDVVPPSMTLVDGCEHAYRFNSDVAFLAAANLIRNTCQGLVSPENRARYRAQVQTGFGIYLDAHVNPPTSPWYIDPLGGSRSRRLRENVRSACRAADEYVWIYGEKNRWWPTPNKGVTEQTWPEALPGAEDALRFGRDPLSAAIWKIDELRRRGELKNLLTGGDFDPATARPGPGKDAAPRPAGWSAWQDGKSRGTFSLDAEIGATAPGSARLSGMADGCFIQGIAVQPGRQYAVEAACRTRGSGQARLIIRWQTADEKWVHEVKDVHVLANGMGGKWERLVAAAEVPEGVGRLVVLLLARGQEGLDDTAWFDDVGVYRLCD